MSSSTETRIQELCTQGFEPRLKGASGAVRFEIEGAGEWTILVDDGSVTQGDASNPADVLVIGTVDEFDPIARSEKNIMTTWLRGDISVTGDSALAASVLNLFR